MSPLVGKALRQSAAGLRATALTVAAVSLGASALLAALGESPRLFFEAVGTSLGTGFGLGYSLFYATPLLLTGLAVAVPFRCGLFNIGAEGQLYLGAAAAVAVAVAFPSLPGIVGIPLAILAAMIAGGSLGAFAGYCKVKRGSHEVITTILLNFLAIAFVNWLILYPLRNPTSQAPESREIGANFMVPSLHDLLAPLGIKFFESTPANASIVFAIVAAVLVHFFLFRTVPGFLLRAVGESEGASKYGGVRVGLAVAGALGLGGALAGLVGINEVLGYRHTLLEGFSPGYGFTGIAVALLSRSRPLRIIPVALFFGALYNGCRELEFLSDKVTKELSLVLQALLVSLAASGPAFRAAVQRRRKRAETKPPTRNGASATLRTAPSPGGT